MLKTATLTWNSFYNYGTCLQAYALQRYILSIGYENSIIDDSTIITGGEVHNSIKKQSKWRQRWTKLWQSFHSNYRAFYKYQRVLCPAVNGFKSTCLKIDYNIESVLNDTSVYDVYICGSDQIWNPTALVDSRRKFYYADFSKKKISYAPSIGISFIPDEWKDKVKELLSSFTAISIREEAGRKVLQEMYQQKVELVVDPTLLLSKEEWSKVLPAKKRKENYVLGYILTPYQQFYKTARDYAHQHGLKFYLFMLNLEDYGQADRLISGGPFDFLRYVYDAEVVFTDSYHGTIFSTIFERPFYTFKRFSDDSPINQNSRIETLLGFMGAQDRLIDRNNAEIPDDSIPDFIDIKARMQPLIEHSKDFLKTNLSAIEKSLNK